MLKHVKTSMSIVKKCKKKCYRDRTYPNMGHHGHHPIISHVIPAAPHPMAIKILLGTAPGICTALLILAGTVATKSAEDTRHSGVHGFLQKETWKHLSENSEREHPKSSIPLVSH